MYVITAWYEYGAIGMIIAKVTGPDHFRDQESSHYFESSNIETDAFCDAVVTNGCEHPETGSFSAGKIARIWRSIHGNSVSYIASLSRLSKLARRTDCRRRYQVTSYP